MRHPILLPFLFASAVSFLASLTPAPAIDGLIGYWTFDGDTGDVAADHSGEGRDGDVIQPDNVWVDDPVRGAVYQSGNGSYIDLGSFLPVLDLASEFTWSLWVFPQETDNNNIVFGNRWDASGADFNPREFIKFTPASLNGTSTVGRKTWAVPRPCLSSMSGPTTSSSNGETN